MFIKKSNISRKSYFMNLALIQARKSLGNTKTNPSVGCLIVKDNFIVSAGFTGYNGTPHAEKNAISINNKDIKNSTLYSTLEPCSNHGKTPPCVNLIIKSKIKKVFFAINDPDVRSFKKSQKKFRSEKISVKNNINKFQSRYFYRSYIKYKNKDLPFVTGKLAVSKDFYSINKKKKWITNTYSRGRVHLLRSSHDCLLSTFGTVIKDDPNFTCRINGLEHTSPARIILDKNLEISTNFNIIKTAKKYKTIIFFNNAKLKKINILKNYGVKLYKIPVDRFNKLILLDVLKKIHFLGYSRVFLESGLRLTEIFLKNSLIDDFYLFISNEKIGINGENNFRKNMKFFTNKKKINDKVNLLGDTMLSYRLK
tara:strand:+ start:158 stop:1258 length:1101 start_codon:yes stop_codon:yes gene_type:complete